MVWIAGWGGEGTSWDLLDEDRWHFATWYWFLRLSHNVNPPKSGEIFITYKWKTCAHLVYMHHVQQMCVLLVAKAFVRLPTDSSCDLLTTFHIVVKKIRKWHKKRIPNVSMRKRGIISFCCASAHTQTRERVKHGERVISGHFATWKNINRLCEMSQPEPSVFHWLPHDVWRITKSTAQLAPTKKKVLHCGTATLDLPFARAWTTVSRNMPL